jgi:hypothetical protein
LALVAVTAAAQDGYKLVASYDRPGLNVPHWEIVIPPAGMAQYTGKPVKGNDPGTVPFQMTDAGHAKLAALLEKSNGMKPCETKSKGIANMGQKQIVYTPASGAPLTCSYNYTENKALGEVFDYLLGVADTVQAGVELERLHKYDRLGLDPVMVRLAEDAKAGKAYELGAIRPQLESLVNDPLVLEGVRVRAQQLLDLAKVQDAEK